MDTIFMNSKNSGTPDPHKLFLDLIDKRKLKKNDRFVALSNLNIYYTWKNIKRLYKDNKSKISAPMWKKWRIWITWWMIFCIRYSRLPSAYHKKHGENNLQ